MNIILLVLALSFPLLSTAPATGASDLECVFEHPRYAGSCVEQVTPEENQTHLQACQAVLACLNDSRCVKSYCQATTLRGGWTLASPKPASRATGQR